jgi:hypothetical protein
MIGDNVAIGANTTLAPTNPAYQDRNTLLNSCGVRGDLIDYVVDISPHKQGLYMPGSRLAIHHPDRLGETRPDYLLILPWNIRDEIMSQMAHIRHWGGKFVLPVPRLEVVAP